MDVETLLASIIELKKGNRELALFYDPDDDLECAWHGKLGNRSSFVALGEINGDYEADGSTMKECLEKLLEQLK